MKTEREWKEEETTPKEEAALTVISERETQRKRRAVEKNKRGRDRRVIKAMGAFASGKDGEVAPKRMIRVVSGKCESSEEKIRALEQKKFWST